MKLKLETAIHKFFSERLVLHNLFSFVFSSVYETWFDRVIASLVTFKVECRNSYFIDRGIIVKKYGIFALGLP